ncbi:hypothetical protein [Streptomyces sp. B1I3]|uniref:hypothetical protein n=1 Tax=Streptomyces sp. B1I3 TaxID=3042264 RepID=UPI00278728D4|nr:hypothetical protein [Streptomyces sp. B1I3]MDQ0798292.1 hypothetical protein [Streptomyces sp. B1I3]
MTTHRRPLGTRPDPADHPGLPTGPHVSPRAGLAAQRLPTTPATDDDLVPTRPAGRRALGTGPTTRR